MKVGVCVNMAGGYWGEGVCECVCVLLYKTYYTTVFIHIQYVHTYVHRCVSVC